MPNIHDVANHAGVSIKTVSRVINNSSGVRVETRRRVEEAIRALDFHPHSWARNLARRRAQTIAVVIPLAPRFVYTDQAYFQVLHGIGEVLEQHGYDLLLHVRGSERSFAGLWKERRADALILMSVPVRDPRVLELRDLGAPFVLTCRADEPGTELDRTVSWVAADDESGADAAVTHLLTLGHRRVALLNGSGNVTFCRLRARGFERALERFGIVADEMPRVSGEFSIETGRALGGLLLDRHDPPTGIFCGDDALAIGVVQAARQRELRVPRDLSVVGYDDIALSPYVDPPLTTVRQSLEQKGRLAAACALRLLGEREPGEVEQHLLSTELVVRQSTGPVRGSDGRGRPARGRSQAAPSPAATPA